MDLTSILASAAGSYLANKTGATSSSGSQIPIAGPWGSPEEEKVWNEAMTGIFGDADTPTLKDQMDANQQFRKNTGAGYLDSIGQANQNYLTDMGGLAEQYLQPQYFGSIGGVTAGGIPKSQRNAYTATSGYLKDILDPQLKYAGEVRDTNLGNQPYQFDYLDKMLGLAVPFNAQRRGMQAEYNPSLFNDFSTLLAGLKG